MDEDKGDGDSNGVVVPYDSANNAAFFDQHYVPQEMQHVMEEMESVLYSISFGK